MQVLLQSACLPLHIAAKCSACQTLDYPTTCFSSGAKLLKCLAKQSLVRCRMEKGMNRIVLVQVDDKCSQSTLWCALT